MSELGYQIARDYESGAVKGWPGLDVARATFEQVKTQHNFVTMSLPYTAGVRAMLYEVCRKVLGKDTENYPQEIGDCVSFGAKNGTEYLTCCEILMGGEREKFRPIFPPYYYGTSRCLIGGQHDYSDGSTGSWMAAAVMKYGALFADEANVPKYTGKVAKAWGHDGPPNEFVKLGQGHLVKSAAEIKSWEDLVASLKNGYPCPTASNVGYSMEAASDGFHRQTTSWSHQMCFIGADETGTEPYAIILNNWGDVHGRLKDFATGDPLPAGVLRVRRKDAEKHIRAGETYAYSNFDGFPEQPIDEKLYKLGGVIQ